MMRLERLPVAETVKYIDQLTESSASDLLYLKELQGLSSDECVAIFDDDALLVIYAVTPGKNFLAPGEVHLLVGKAYSVKYARLTHATLQGLARRFCGLRTLIDITFRPGCRFAKFLGFRPRGEPFDYAGRRFQLYEVYV